MYITSESSSTVSVIDPLTNQVIKTFLVGARPREAVFTNDNARAYVTAENGCSVSVVDSRDHQVIKTIELPRGEGATQLKPKGIVISADGKRVYVATGRGNSVAVINGETLELITLIPVGQRPWGIAITPDGRKLYTANGLSNDISVIDLPIDLTPEQKADRDKLSNLSGAEFDREYMIMMVADHDKDVNAFETKAGADHFAEGELSAWQMSRNPTPDAFSIVASI